MYLATKGSTTNANEAENKLLFSDSIGPDAMKISENDDSRPVSAMLTLPQR